ncbi:MAG TPA: CbrC family protein [Humisphaera sp.]
MNPDSPFPLFKAPLDPGYHAAHVCTVCRRGGAPRLSLADSDHLVTPCRRCGEPMGLRVGYQDTPCPRCGEFNLWPSDVPTEEAAVCFDCLVGGRAAISHASELGHIEWPDAVRGLVAGGSEAVARREGLELWTDEWGPPTPYVKAPAPALMELLRTPRHPGRQSEHWPIHCGRFRAFLGHWGQSDFDRHAAGRGREWFEEHLEPSSGAGWDWLGDDFAESTVYQCLNCLRFIVYVDTD